MRCNAMQCNANAACIHACMRLPLHAQEKRAKEAAAASNATLAVTGAVGWRREGLKYKKNEVCAEGGCWERVGG